MDEEELLLLKHKFAEIKALGKQATALPNTPEGRAEGHRLALELRDKMVRLREEVPAELAGEIGEQIAVLDRNLQFAHRWGPLTLEIQSILSAGQALPFEGDAPSEAHLALMHRIVALIDQHTEGVPPEEWTQLAEVREKAMRLLQMDPRAGGNPSDETENSDEAPQ
jgi:hypothetical protein